MEKYFPFDTTINLSTRFLLDYHQSTLMEICTYMYNAFPYTLNTRESDINFPVTHKSIPFMNTIGLD